MIKQGSDKKLGLQGAWSMAVGGMIGGGIFSTLGIVVAIAGDLAWLSFLIAGLIALAAGYSYVQLALKYNLAGGSFTFLRKVGAYKTAGAFSWILIVGYVLTNTVYAFTFGEYLGHVVGLEHGLFTRLVGVSWLMVFVAINCRDVGENQAVEIFLVWFKLIALILLAGLGLYHWQPEMLSRGVADVGLTTAIFGAASIFMAYEGFQLLAYDYDDLSNPRKVLPTAMLGAVASVILVYILVAIGVPMIIGADQVVANQEVALALAGEAVGGTTGLVLVTIAAAFSTGSAINSTLFATARLAKLVAEQKELPTYFLRCNTAGVPTHSVMALGLMSAVLVLVGSLSSLVEAASLAFLCTFSVVSGLAFWQKAGNRLITFIGTLASLTAAGVLLDRLLHENIPAVIAFVLLVLAAVFLRPRLLAKTTE